MLQSIHTHTRQHRDREGALSSQRQAGFGDRGILSSQRAFTGIQCNRQGVFSLEGPANIGMQIVLQYYNQILRVSIH